MAIGSCDHAEFIVCFETSKGSLKCPVCDKDENIEDLEQQIETAKEEIAELKDQLAESQ